MSFKETTVLGTEIRNAKNILLYITEYPLICELKPCVTGQPVLKSLPKDGVNTVLLAQLSHSFPFLRCILGVKTCVSLRPSNSEVHMYVEDNKVSFFKRSLLMQVFIIIVIICFHRVPLKAKFNRLLKSQMSHINGKIVHCDCA